MYGYMGNRSPKKGDPRKVGGPLWTILYGDEMRLDNRIFYEVLPRVSDYRGQAILVPDTDDSQEPLEQNRIIKKEKSSSWV